MRMEITGRIWTCALTGHRALPEDFDENALYDKLNELIELGCTKFLCGMACGFDLRALRCLIDLRMKYRFEIEACIPYRGHDAKFSAEEKKLLKKGLELCDRVTVLFEHYRAGCFLARNRYMVEHADAVLAYCKKEQSGTAYTVDYAFKKGVPVIFLN